MAQDWRHDRVASALRGTNPTVMRRLAGGFAVIGDVQFLPGYSLLLTDRANVDRLSELPRAERTAFLHGLDLLGEAVERACKAADPAFRRVNLEVLGNREAFLHAHVWPRYEWEPEEIRSGPVWWYPRSHWQDPQYQLGQRHTQLRQQIARTLDHLTHTPQPPGPEIS